MKKSKKIIIIVIFVILLIIVSVVYKLKSDDIYVSETLIGESEHWKVNYQVNGYVKFYKSDGKFDLTSGGYKKILVKYKGDIEEISQLRNLNVKTLNGGGGISLEESPSNNIFKFPNEMEDLTALRYLDLRVIMVPYEEQEHVRQMLPNAKVHFSKACNCKF